MGTYNGAHYEIYNAHIYRGTIRVVYTQTYRGTHIETQYAHMVSDTCRDTSKRIQRQASPETRNAIIYRAVIRASNTGKYAEDTLDKIKTGF